MYTKCIQQNCQCYREKEQLSSKYNKEEQDKKPTAETHSKSVRRKKDFKSCIVLSHPSKVREFLSRHKIHMMQ